MITCAIQVALLLVLGWTFREVYDLGEMGLETYTRTVMCCAGVWMLERTKNDDKD